MRHRRGRIAAPTRRGRRHCADLGCRHAAGFRSRLQTGARRARSRTLRYGAAGRLALCWRRLTVAGLPTDQFLFAGFLPPKQAARRTRIAELARIPATLVLFETGPRLAATLADLAAGLGAGREAAVCRELTKLHEEIRRGDLATLAQSLAGHASRAARSSGDRSAAPAAQPSAPRDRDAMLREALNRVSLKDAVAEVADATGCRGASFISARSAHQEMPQEAAMARRAEPLRAAETAATAGTGHGFPARDFGGEPRRDDADRQSLSDRGAALEDAVRRNRHRCAAAARRWCSSRSKRATSSTTRPKR